MRKIILVAAMVLVSASAQAGDRSLSLSAATRSAPQTTHDHHPDHANQRSRAGGRCAEICRPPAGDPGCRARRGDGSRRDHDDDGLSAGHDEQACTEDDGEGRQAQAQAAWTERRIIAELHRHGIYW